MEIIKHSYRSAVKDITGSHHKFASLLSTVILLLSIITGTILVQQNQDFRRFAKKSSINSNLNDYFTNNLLLNSSFEQGLSKWNHSTKPEDANSVAELVSGSECINDNCIRLEKGDAEWQAFVQLIPSLHPNNYYRFTFNFKTSSIEEAFVNMYDLDWKNSAGEVVGNSFQKRVQGNGGWQRSEYFIRFPNADDSGEDTSNHRWYIYLYGHAADQIFYDDVRLSSSATLPDSYTELDETNVWDLRCEQFTDGKEFADCPEMIAKSPLIKASGNTSIKISSERDKKVYLSTSLPVEPSTNYKLTVSLSNQNWQTYNYLELNFPSIYTEDRPGIRDNIDDTKGIWSGLYEFRVDDNNILQPRWWKTPQISPSTLDWFTEEVNLTTKKDQYIVELSSVLSGLDAQHYIDNVSLAKIDSIIEDKYFNTPITHMFQNLKVIPGRNSTLSLVTEAGNFSFTNDQIVFSKDRVILSAITFPSGTLDRLKNTEKDGYVLLENNNTLISIGADSVLLLKTKKPMEITVSGSRLSYSNFEAGNIFVTDFSKGFLFSPIRDSFQIASMPHLLNEKDLTYTYSDTDLDAASMKNWDVVSGFDNSNWNITYHLKGGDGIISQIFPPKQKDENGLCTLRAGTGSFDRRNFPASSYEYNLTKFKEENNILLLWPNEFVYSVNELQPPENYCLDSSNNYVNCSSENVATRIPVTFLGDINTSFGIFDPGSFQSLITKAHENGLKVVFYITPEYYYTSNVDSFLGQVDSLISTYNLDGVYYDGLYRNDVLKSLELARKTRNLLGDKLYIQHNSWTRSVIYASDKFRLPFQDAYADLVWVGEGIKSADEDIWKINYCGLNVGGSTHVLLGELRPVDYSEPINKDYSVGLSLSPQEQIEKTFSCGGIYKLYNPYSPTSYVEDKKLQTQINYPASLVYDQYDNSCLETTCGNGSCDVGENINNCINDCTTSSGSAVNRSGNSFSCNNPGSIVQWHVNGDPLLSLLFTFDAQVIKDVSGWGNHLSQNLDTTLDSSTLAEEGERKIHKLNGTSELRGIKQPNLDLNGTNFSTFITFKRDVNSESYETLFAFNDKAHFMFGILNSRAYAVIRNSNNQTVSLTGNTLIDSNNWYSMGVVYESSRFKLYVNGNLEAETAIGPLTFTTNDMFYIGNNNGKQGFTGSIDDLIITKTAFNSEMAINYHQSRLGSISTGETDDVICITIDNSTILRSSGITIPTPTPTSPPPPCLVDGSCRETGKVCCSNFTYIDYSCSGGEKCGREPTPTPPY